MFSQCCWDFIAAVIIASPRGGATSPLHSLSPLYILQSVPHWDSPPLGSGRRKHVGFLDMQQGRRNFCISAPRFPDSLFQSLDWHSPPPPLPPTVRTVMKHDLICVSLPPLSHLSRLAVSNPRHSNLLFESPPLPSASFVTFSLPACPAKKRRRRRTGAGQAEEILLSSAYTCRVKG